MHYGPKAFSINGKNTITAKNGHSIGQRQGLSVIDVEQARTMYTACNGGGGGSGILIFYKYNAHDWLSSIQGRKHNL